MRPGWLALDGTRRRFLLAFRTVRSCWEALEEMRIVFLAAVVVAVRAHYETMMVTVLYQAYG